MMTGRTEALHNCHFLADYPDISTSLARDYLFLNLSKLSYDCFHNSTISVKIHQAVLNVNV